MSHILTFVASHLEAPLKDSHFKEAKKIMGFYNLEPAGKPVWLAKKKAADLPLAEKPPGALLTHLQDMLAPNAIDLFITKAEGRKKKLLLADMDSTIVDGETLDELAAFAGIKDEIAAITVQAMEGKLDFKEALRERVALLKDLPAETLDQTLERTQLNPGAQQLVRAMKENGATCILVSGGFTFFTERIAQEAGFDHHHGNVLIIENGKLTGKVQEPILDKMEKSALLQKYCEEMNITAEDCLTIGDGANDIPMLKMAGLGIGYHPRQAVAQEIDNLILYGDLTAALYAQGFTEA